MDKCDIINRCIEEILDGRLSLEDCLRMHPEFADELRSLLNIAQRIQKQSPSVSQEFRQRARTRLALEEGLISLKRQSRGTPRNWLNPVALVKGLRVPLTVIIVISLLGSGTAAVYASRGSLPGEVLYPVKIGTENLQLVLTVTPESKVNLNLKLAERRVEEMATQTRKGLDVNITTPQAVARYLDNAIKQIDHLEEKLFRSLISQLSQSTINQQVALGELLNQSPGQAQKVLEETADTSRRGNMVARVARDNPAFLDSAPSVTDKELERTYFELEGILQSTASGNWNIGGITIENVTAFGIETPPVNRRVKVEGVIRGDRTFITKIKQKEGENGGQVKIEGIFGGTSADGNTWYVGGIPIARPQNVTAVPEGTQIELKGLFQDGILVITEVESEEEDDEERVRISGTLLEVNLITNTIIVDVAGARITVSVREAEIRRNDGHRFELSILPSLVGREVRISDPETEGGILRAEKVYVDAEDFTTATEGSGGPAGTTEVHEESDEDDEQSDEEDNERSNGNYERSDEDHERSYGDYEESD